MYDGGCCSRTVASVGGGWIKKQQQRDEVHRNHSACTCSRCIHVACTLKSQKSTNTFLVYLQLLYDRLDTLPKIALIMCGAAFDWPAKKQNRAVPRYNVNPQTAAVECVGCSHCCCVVPVERSNETGVGLQAPALPLHSAGPPGLHPDRAVPQRVPVDHLGVR